MYLKIMRIAIFVACLGFMKASTDVSHESDLVKDHKEALSYCKTHENTYMAVVWPRGVDWIDTIIGELSQHGKIRYIKKISFTKNGTFLLYRWLHKRLSLPSAEKYFKGYLAGDTEKNEIICIVFETDLSLKKIFEVKRKIRSIIGIHHRSIHINDRHTETVEAAEAFFHRSIRKIINTLPPDHDIKKEIDAIIYGT